MINEVKPAVTHPPSTSPDALAHSDQSGSESLQLEREKFEFSQKVQTAEFDLKKAESLRSRWTNPFIVAIIGALLVGIGNMAVSAYNGYSQRSLEKQTAKDQEELADRNNNYSIALEGIKEENASVLEIEKLADPEKVRSGLCMLVALNSLKSPAAKYAVQDYLAHHQGCPESSEPQHKADWITAQLTIPGCGESGCNALYQVCGSAPANTKITGNVRNYTDSFGNAYGDWVNAPVITSSQVCRAFNQHSHNVTRTVSFQFEVAPTS